MKVVNIVVVAFGVWFLSCAMLGVSKDLTKENGEEFVTKFEALSPEVQGSVLDHIIGERLENGDEPKLPPLPGWKDATKETMTSAERNIRKDLESVGIGDFLGEKNKMLMNRIFYNFGCEIAKNYNTWDNDTKKNAGKIVMDTIKSFVTICDTLKSQFLKIEDEQQCWAAAGINDTLGLGKFPWP